MLRLAFLRGSLLGVLIVALSVSQASGGDPRPLSGQDAALLDSLLNGPKASVPIPGFSGVAESPGPKRKTKEISTFFIRIANAANMKSRKTEDAQNECSKQNLRKQHRRKFPFVVMESSRDNIPVRKFVLETPMHLKSPNAYGYSADERPTIIEQIVRSKRGKSISPLIFIIHRRLVQNTTKNANATLSASRREIAEDSKNLNAESSRRRQELAIDVIKKVLLNKILSSSRLGMRPKPDMNDSSLGVMAAPGVLTQKLPLAAEDTKKSAEPKPPSFEFFYDVQVVKYSDGEPGQEIRPYVLTFVPGGQLAAEVCVSTIAMIVLPLPIIGLLLMLSRLSKTTAKRRIIKNPVAVTMKASCLRTKDGKLKDKPTPIKI